MTPPAAVLAFLRAIRKQHPHLSKYKLKVFLDAWCREQGLPNYSVSWIGKVISRYQFFFGTKKNLRKKRRKSRSGYTIKRTPNPDKVSLGYLQLDGIKVYWMGKEALFLTALELKTRKAWAILVPTINSRWAKTLLLSVMAELMFSLHSIHTDNGSEFKAVFDQAVTELGLTHLWGLPRKPKIQAHIERFNGIFQDEFVSYHIEEAILNKQEFQASLTNWLSWYNQERPHHSLGMMTPNQYLLHLRERS
jgi:transposase InsO family protein